MASRRQDELPRVPDQREPIRITGWTHDPPKEKTTLIKQNPKKNHYSQCIVITIAVIIVLSAVTALALSVVYMYQPGMRNYHTAICNITKCSTKQIACCSGKTQRTCSLNNYTELSIVLSFDGIVYAKNETYDCDGPWMNYNWAYNNMCYDSELVTIPCYYDDRNVSSTLHLSQVWQTPPLNAVIAISCFTILTVSFIIFLITYNIHICKKNK